MAFMVVSSIDAAWQPSSVEPASHIPAKAATLLKKEKGEKMDSISKRIKSKERQELEEREKNEKKKKPFYQY